MLFPTHLVAGYLLARVIPVPVPWVILGAALPDLIDKPLAMLGVTSLYHTVGHSIVFLVGLGVLSFFGRRWFALWIGVLSHLFLDALQMAVNGRPGDAQFLLWPFVHHEPEIAKPPIEFAIYYVGTPSFALELLIWAGAGILVGTDVWARIRRRDGPGSASP